MTQAMVRPKPLRHGAKLAVISPASTPRRELVEQGLNRLRTLGYEPTLGAHALSAGPLYYAGAVRDRVSDLHEAFTDTSVDGVLCTRGGWGSAELLPYLDAERIRANPKPFVGYSDHTSLHVWLRQEINLVTYYGPMVSPDFSRADGVHQRSWSESLHTRGPWSVTKAEGLRVLQSGFATGQIYGGCLSIYAESLGTPYSARPESGILFLEDVGTKPYQWDRMLLHLRLAGLLNDVQGIVFGDMAQSVRPEEEPLLEAAILHALREFRGPIAMGLTSGHVHGENVTLPFGVEVELDLRDPEVPRLSFMVDAATSQSVEGL